MWKFYSWFWKFALSLHLDELEDDVSEEKDLENDSSVEIRDVNTSYSDNGLKVKDMRKCWIRLQGNFVSKNVVNLSRGI